MSNVLSHKYYKKSIQLLHSKFYVVEVPVEEHVVVGSPCNIKKIVSTPLTCLFKY